MDIVNIYLSKDALYLIRIFDYISSFKFKLLKQIFDIANNDISDTKNKYSIHLSLLIVNYILFKKKYS